VNARLLLAAVSASSQLVGRHVCLQAYLSSPLTVSLGTLTQSTESRAIDYVLIDRQSSVRLGTQLGRSVHGNLDAVGLKN